MGAQWSLSNWLTENLSLRRWLSSSESPSQALRWRGKSSTHCRSLIIKKKLKNKIALLKFKLFQNKCDISMKAIYH